MLNDDDTKGAVAPGQAVLREIAMANPALIELGLHLLSKYLTYRYLTWLQNKRLIRLETTAEIMAETHVTA